MAAALAGTGGTPAASTSAPVISTLPASDTTPLAATNATNGPTQPLTRRSRHVQRRCQPKLCASAASTASATAGA